MCCRGTGVSRSWPRTCSSAAPSRSPTAPARSSSARSTRPRPSGLRDEPRRRDRDVRGTRAGGRRAGSYLEPMARIRLAAAHPGLRRRGGARRHGVPRPHGPGHERDSASGCSASTPRAATGSTSSTSTTPRRLQMADRLTLFRLMVKQVAKEAGLFATFMPKPYTEAWGSGHHFNMSLADVEIGGEPVPRRRRCAGPGLEQDGLRLRGRHPAPRPRHGRHLHADGQLLQAAGSPACPTGRCRGRRSRRPTATTTGRACCACPATAPPWRTGAWTRRPTPTWPPPSCWPPAWRAWPRASIPATPSRTDLQLGRDGPSAAAARATGRGRDAAAPPPAGGDRGLRH